MHGLISVPVLIVVATLLAMILRPRGYSEASISAVGALFLLVTGSVPVDILPDILGDTTDVLLFLLGMMVVTGIAERAGVLALLADIFVDLARGSGPRLFVLISVLGALITTFLSLDVTVIVLTPIVFAIVTRRGIEPLPFLFICAFVANIASLALPISNLTNLLMFDRLDLGFLRFVSVMWLPNLVAGTVNVLVFFWIFRSQIPKSFSRERHLVTEPNAWLLVSACLLALTLVAVSVLGVRDLPIWWGSLGGAFILGSLALVRRKSTFRNTLHDVSPSIFVFVVSLSVVVEGFQRAWLDAQTISLPSDSVSALAVSIGVSAFGSNIVNNIPMTVLALGTIESGSVAGREALAYGTLVGANIGPALTTYGSLATMLWFTQLRRRGIAISTAEYMRVSILTVPPVLIATGITLWLVLLF